MDLREKLRVDWTRRALADAAWWACQTPDVDEEAAKRKAEVDLEALTGGLGLGADAAVLEIGCGTGRLCGRLADQHIAVVGVDISPAMLEAAKVLEPERPSLRYVLTDGVRLPFPLRSFDLVFSYAVLQHVDPSIVVGALTQVRRVLKPQGVLRIQAWLGDSVDRPPAGDTLRLRAWSREELDAWFLSAGLEVVSVGDLDPSSAEPHRRSVLITGRRAGESLRPPILPAVGERSSAAEIAEEWGFLLSFVQNAAAAGENRRALHAVRAGNRLLPEQAVGWWVEARLLASIGRADDALQSLDRLDAMPPRPEDAQVREAAEALRRTLDEA
jgi:SAM-dependent methyltransferase